MEILTVPGFGCELSTSTPSEYISANPPALLYTHNVEYTTVPELIAGQTSSFAARQLLTVVGGATSHAAMTVPAQTT